MLEAIEGIALIFSSCLLLVVIAQYIVLSLGRKRRPSKAWAPPISILIPAHNEAQHLREVLNSVLGSGYKGRKEIIVIDDGSTDETPEIVEEFRARGVKSLRTPHLGKSKALNKGLGVARHDVIVTIDGDTKIERGALDKLIAPLADKRVAIATGAIKVADQKGILCWFQRVEYLYLLFYKALCDRLDGVVWASGTLSAFRRDCLKEGFDPNLFMEDVDIALRLIKRGRGIRYVPEARAYTFVPKRLRDFVRQRCRWVRGGIQIMKKHRDLILNPSYPGPGFFTLPLMLYWYFHAWVMIVIFLQVFLGYYRFYYIAGNVLSMEVARYFFNWFSLFGVLNLAYQILIGNFPLTALYLLTILMVVLMYALYVYAIKWSGDRIGTKDVIALIFMFPYWILLMLIYMYGSIEWFRPSIGNWWRK
jgi:cellulose synthase/poly-beta-1,6-N-acetylglucosamine synthase-like glycosyltransferase